MAGFGIQADGSGRRRTVKTIGEFDGNGLMKRRRTVDRADLQAGASDESI